MMTDRSIGDYSHLDSPEILMGLFHPRPDYGSIERVTCTIDMMIPVENNITGGRSFPYDREIGAEYSLLSRKWRNCQ